MLQEVLEVKCVGCNQKKKIVVKRKCQKCAYRTEPVYYSGVRRAQEIYIEKQTKKDLNGWRMRANKAVKKYMIAHPDKYALSQCKSLLKRLTPKQRAWVLEELVK